MKKLVDFVMPMKLIAGGVLAGLIGFYMVVGAIYARVSGADFEYSIPFAFIIQGAVLAICIAVLWEVFFCEIIIRKLRFFPRVLMFNASLAALIAASVLTSSVLSSDWAYLWLTGATAIAIGIGVIACLAEVYFRKTGQRYNELLRAYQRNPQTQAPGQI